MYKKQPFTYYRRYKKDYGPSTHTLPSYHRRIILFWLITEEAKCTDNRQLKEATKFPPHTTGTP